MVSITLNLSLYLVVKLMPRAAGVVVRVEFLAAPGETYAIEASTDLEHWVPIGVRTADAEGVVVWDDPVGGQLKHRFYRARLAQ